MKIILAFLGNLIGLVAATFLLPGLELNFIWSKIILFVLFLTLINLVTGPLLKLIFWPLTVITLGLVRPFLILLTNFLGLFTIDWLSADIATKDSLTLLLLALIITCVNAAIGLWSRISSPSPK